MQLCTNQNIEGGTMDRFKLLRLALALALALVLASPMAVVLGQTRAVIGLHENTPNVLALTNATITVAPGKVLENATLVIRDGHIEAVGTNVAVPADAVKKDLQGKHIYPGFIDLFTNYGLPKQARGAARTGAQPPGARQQPPSPKAGAHYWNRAVQAERDAAEMFKADTKTAESLRKTGITTVLTFPADGVFRGEAALVLVGDGDPTEMVLAEKVAQAVSFQKGRSLFGRGVAGYPGSLMGHIALIRQVLLDARWYRDAWRAFQAAPAGQEPPETNLSLEALQEYAFARKPVVLDIRDSELDILRAAKIAAEFGLDMWVRGSGSEYRRLQAIKNAGVKLIVPVNFPEPPQVVTLEEEMTVTLRELRHWDLAPENPARLAAAGLPFALTAATLKKPDSFLEQVRTAVERGLAADAALAALTTTPASWLRMENILSTLEHGKLANLLVTNGGIFNSETKILDTYVAGKRYEINPTPELDIRGTWTVNLVSAGKTESDTVTISGTALQPRAELKIQNKKIKASKLALDGRLLALSFPGDSIGMAGVARLSGIMEGTRGSGEGRWGDGTPFKWTAERIKPHKEKLKKSKEKKKQQAEFAPLYPDGAFGFAAAPAQPEAVFVKNATIWTSGPQGKLENADMLVRRGKIVQVGKGLKAPGGALVIDATGRHVTPGIIDAHSHTAIDGGVNEGTHAISSEVRIRDVVDSDDINIYRQLAGGTTMANLLHGSANPIGGQNAVVKFRWGATPDEMLFTAAKPTIKFALGENVKQSNWGDNFRTRYPQTRMGVEQFFRDNFQAAKDYRRTWQEYNARKKKNKNIIPPRKDLRLEALLEILDGKRQIHCHSYRQDEILALIRVADEMGFRVDVFTHILEGYKVADDMAKHGSMASTFSDWWAYKFEVYDAIPYNGALMFGEGLVVGYNSDSSELARRLNTEAAKAVKYGGVPEEEALKFVTLNPAKQLHVENRVGSLEPGKDADFVIWSGSPLSTYTICEQTWIDGRKYFDIAEDKKMRAEAAKQRAALVQKILKAGSKKDGKKSGSRLTFRNDSKE